MLQALAGPETQAFVGAVTAWEYQDSRNRGRLPVAQGLDEVLALYALTVLDFPAGAWSIAARLPDLHRDPVDRMLMAHAIAADATLATADETIRRYPVETI